MMNNCIIWKKYGLTCIQYHLYYKSLCFILLNFLFSICVIVGVNKVQLYYYFCLVFLNEIIKMILLFRTIYRDSTYRTAIYYGDLEYCKCKVFLLYIYPIFNLQKCTISKSRKKTYHNTVLLQYNLTGAQFTFQESFLFLKSRVCVPSTRKPPNLTSIKS